MTFYQNLFGGDLELLEVKGSQMEGHWPSAPDGALYHSALTKDGDAIIMGSDMSGPNGQIIGNNIQLAIACTSEDEINTMFNKLADGGVVLDSLKTQFWGGHIWFC